MADGRDELDLDGSESISEATPKKRSGIKTLLPKILKFGAIGLGALIFIVTVVIITFKIMSGSGSSQTVVTNTESYTPKRPQLSWFTNIGVIRTKTRDTNPHAVVVNVIIGYDLDSKTAQNELTNRLYELKDFVRNFFSMKYAADLVPANENHLKLELKEQLNTYMLVDSKVREILFQQLDVD